MLVERLVRDGAPFAQAWNFGPPVGEEMRVRDLVDCFARAWGVARGWQSAEGQHPPEAPLLRLDAAEAMQRLGWQPTLSQNDAICETAAWYRSYLTGPSDVGGLCDAALTQHATRLSRIERLVF
jgi:CDP-glucose 4,6-dehydratase